MNHLVKLLPLLLIFATAGLLQSCQKAENLEDITVDIYNDPLYDDYLKAFKKDVTHMISYNRTPEVPCYMESICDYDNCNYTDQRERDFFRLKCKMLTLRKQLLNKYPSLNSMTAEEKIAMLHPRAVVNQDELAVLLSNRRGS